MTISPQIRNILDVLSGPNGRFGLPLKLNLSS